MRLGNLKLNPPLMMAPMAGMTDYPFRKLVLTMGCALAFTEMVSAEGLLRKGRSFLDLGTDEHPVFVQLFGADPEPLAEAAGMAEAGGADGIDLNMGCPVKKVVALGAGAALMKSPQGVERIFRAVRKRVRVPLTVKIRSGWDKDQINAVPISKIAEDCGVDAVILHARTRAQGFRGQADWGLIRELKRSVCIPVIGNGGVTTPLLARRLIEETDCDGVMIGRGALGNPWIFGPGRSGRPDREGDVRPSIDELERVIQYHFSLIQTTYGDMKALKEMKKHLFLYTRGLRSSAAFRMRLSKIKERELLFETMRSFFDRVQGESYADPSGEQQIHPLLDSNRETY
jgi:tRNA-dihydrouridine synthase B